MAYVYGVRIRMCCYFRLKGERTAVPAAGQE